MAFNQTKLVFKSCRECKERYVGCHSNCPKYLAEKAQHDSLKAVADEKKRISGDFYELYQRSTFKKLKRRQGGIKRWRNL